MRTKVLRDMAINIAASAIPLLVLKLIVLPLVAIETTSGQYGLVVTVDSFLSFCPATIGNVINNVRLIRNRDYESEHQGDFNVITLMGEAVSLICTIAYFASLNALAPLNGILAVLASVLWLLQSYWLVAFRIKIDYVGVFINNVVMSAGYLVGLLAFHTSGYWAFVYLTGQVFADLHLMRVTSLWKEPMRRTKLFKPVLVDTVTLAGSSLLARASSYCDRLILYPLLGGAAVSVYYVSTLFAKVISMITTPVSNVVLSYLAVREKAESHRFRITMIVGAVACCVAYFAILLIAGPAMRLIYPKFADAALMYLPITSITALVSVLYSLANPFVLRFCPMRWQMLFSAVTLIIYLAAALVLLSVYGMMGFCWGALIAETARLLLVVVAYSRVAKTEDSNERN